MNCDAYVCHRCESAVFAVCLLCFRRQAQILRRRYSSRSVQRLHSNRSTRSRRSIGQIDRNVFSRTPQFFPDSEAVYRNAGASHDVAQRSNCQRIPWSRRASMRWMNSRGIVSKSKHRQCIARRAAPVHPRQHMGFKQDTTF